MQSSETTAHQRTTPRPSSSEDMLADTLLDRACKTFLYLKAPTTSPAVSLSLAHTHTHTDTLDLKPFCPRVTHVFWCPRGQLLSADSVMTYQLNDGHHVLEQCTTISAFQEVFLMSLKK